MARPSDYSEEVAAQILGRMAEGESLRAICKSDDMPAASTVYLWLQRHSEFSEKYEAAALDRAHMMAEEALEIADDGTNDWMARRSSSEKGAGVNEGWVLNGEHVQRSRLRVDTRKWFAARLNPKKYGDKIEATHQGGEKPIDHVFRWGLSPSEGTSDPSVKS